MIGFMKEYDRKRGQLDPIWKSESKCKFKSEEKGANAIV